MDNDCNLFFFFVEASSSTYPKPFLVNFYLGSNNNNLKGPVIFFYWFFICIISRTVNLDAIKIEILAVIMGF